MTGKRKKIGIALIGAGGIGKRYGNALKKSKEFKLLFVVDTDTTRAKSVADNHPGCEIFSDWRKLHTKKEVEAVIVATPHVFLSSISIGCLKMGKHVLSEKPGGVSSLEIKKTIQVAKSLELNYMIGFNHRFHESFLLAQKLVSQQKIGKIQFIRSVYGFGGRKGFEREWRHNQKISGGGELIDQGIHMIDMIRLFLGDITAASGFVDSLYWNTQVEDNAFVILKNKKQLASIHVSWSNWKPTHQFEIYGSEGYIRIEGLGRKYGGEEKVYVGKKDVKNPDHPIEKEYICNPDADQSLVRELVEFGKSIQEKRRPYPSGEDGYEALRVVEKIYRQQKKYGN